VKDNHRPDLGRTQSNHERRIKALERRQLPLGKQTVVSGDVVAIIVAGGAVDSAFDGGISTPAHILTFSFSLLGACTLTATLTSSVRLQTGSGAWGGYIELLIDGGGLLPGRATWQQAGASEEDELPFTIQQAAQLEAGDHTIEFRGFSSPTGLMHGLDGVLLGLIGPTIDLNISCD
jgi:hypothetical protein